MIVQVAYTKNKMVHYSLPLRVFGDATSARDWCLHQNEIRSSLEVYTGTQYYYVSMVVDGTSAQALTERYQKQDTTYIGYDGIEYTDSE